MTDIVTDPRLAGPNPVVGLRPGPHPEARDIALATAKGEHKPLDGTREQASAPGNDRPLLDGPVESIEPFTP
jgi:hypothetical protein